MTATASPSKLLVSGLTKTYHGSQGDLNILQAISFEVLPGEALAITGPSGAGKSTLLYVLGVLDQPTAGTVLFGDENPFSLSAPEQARFRNTRIGFVFQDHHLLPQCTVLENVLIPTLPGHVPDATADSRARQLLERVGLNDRLQHRPAQLSGGERQRVAVCRALINRPLLLLADEPTGNLDRSTAESIGSLLLDLSREEQTVLICVTHSQELAARFPRHVELRNGQLQDARQPAMATPS